MIDWRKDVIRWRGKTLYWGVVWLHIHIGFSEYKIPISVKIWWNDKDNGE